jgi:intein/homing endonuclease
MKKDFSYKDNSPRFDKIIKLKRKLDKISSILKDTVYKNSSEMFEDLNSFLNTEKEIQIQESYMKLEEMYFNGEIA